MKRPGGGLCSILRSGPEGRLGEDGQTGGGLQGRLGVEGLEVNVDGQAGGLVGSVGVCGLPGKGLEMASAVLGHVA